MGNIELIIGHDVFDTTINSIVHVQDTDVILGVAKVGFADINGIVWNPYWVEFDKLKPVEIKND